MSNERERSGLLVDLIMVEMVRRPRQFPVKSGLALVRALGFSEALFASIRAIRVHQFRILTSAFLN